MTEISITEAPISDMPISDEPVADGTSVDANGNGQIDLAVLQELLDNVLRPAIQVDGGDLILLGVDQGTVNLQMVGACGGCPMSSMTLKAGIERILMDRVPGVVAVNAQ